MKTLLHMITVFLFIVLAPLAAQPKICIDAGHGGSDPGAVGNGLRESDINLDIALKLRSLLNADTADTSGGSSWRVLMVRTGDTSVSLAGRTAYANSNGANRFISIHANSFSVASANGTETFRYRNGSTNSRLLQTAIHEELIDAGGLRDRGIKTAGFYVLRYTSMPAMLSEQGFVSNSGDAAEMAKGAWRTDMAKAHMYGLQRHYGVAAYDPTQSVERGTVTLNMGDTALNPVRLRARSSGDVVRVAYLADDRWPVGESANAAGGYAVDTRFYTVGQRKITVIGYGASGRELARDSRTVTVQNSAFVFTTPSVTDNPVALTAQGDANVASVRYYANDTYLLGSSSNRNSDFPVSYRFNFTGTRSLSAVAFDSNGNEINRVDHQIQIND
ncbi:N-acetylmuramoyl-L-alanine amidase family protein [Acanthopleuribacter pedis]|uniref:N-acetylmuramoyl-L-alanine amidase n=1 Tax=Acanthopleuribacter pedis TaxID=442870 RepID=A0A8J7Q6S7_9BACT|nr:N-acetylmuramoyl-L-alanine amidase [Acanthopleuribacter pedis]MBO1319246.1 N-acetylmuramoyl-L-alanine amidase [Acanthopleuribacter pedis]